MNRPLAALFVVLVCLGGLPGAPTRAHAQEVPEGVPVGEWRCTYCNQPMSGPGADGCPQASGHGGGGGGGGGDGGGAPSGDGAFNLLVAPITCPVMFGVGLGLGFAWLAKRVSGGTEESIWDYIGLEEAQETYNPLMSGFLAMGGALAFTLYLPAAGVTELGDLALDDDAEASTSVRERATELEAQHQADHATFVGAYPSPGAADPVDLRSWDDAALGRARGDAATAAAREVLASPALAAPVGPAWPATAPLSRDARPAFVVPPPPPPGDPASLRTAGLLERTRGLLGEGAAAARDGLVADAKSRALGLLPDGVERALEAHLAVSQGTMATLESVRDEGVQVLAFGSANQAAALARKTEGETQATAEATLDAASGNGDDPLLDFGRRWLGGKGK